MTRVPRLRIFPARRSDSGQPMNRTEEAPEDDRFLAAGLCLAPLFISGAAACLASGSRTYLCTTLSVPAYRTLALSVAALMALFLLRVLLSAWKYGRRRSGVFWPAAGISLVAALLAVWAVAIATAFISCGGPVTS
jgi:hypothetical protein